MKKEELLKLIATNAYDVGFGAKRHFSSYDIIIKLPYWISFITLSVGVVQVGYPDGGYSKEISIGLILVGIASLFLNFFNSEKNNYDSTGTKLTQQFKELRTLYFTVKDLDNTNYASEVQAMDKIMVQFYESSISRQVFLSNLFAHFKFFYEMQIDWIDNELKFKFFKDKVPNSLKITLIIFLIVSLVIIFLKIKNEYFPNFY